MTHTAPARYPPTKSWGRHSELSEWPQPTSRCMGRGPRASTALFTHCFNRGHICFHRREQCCCADRTAPSTGCFVSRQNCAGIAIRLSAFSATPCVGSIRATGEPDLPCASDQPGHQSTTNMGHICCEWTTRLPGLLNSTTAYRSDESFTTIASWLPPTTDAAKRMVSADLPAIDAGLPGRARKLDLHSWNWSRKLRRCERT